MTYNETNRQLLTRYNFVFCETCGLCRGINDTEELVVLSLHLFDRQQEQIMLENFSREYNNNKILLSNIGLWPFQNKFARILLPTFLILLESSYIPFEILMFCNNGDNIDLIFESCYQLGVSTAFLVRLLHQISNRSKLQQLYKDMDDHWNIFTNDMEIRILKNYSAISQKFTMFYGGVMYVMTFIMTLSTLTPQLLDIILPLNESRTRIFMIVVDFRVDQNEYFIPIFVYTTVLIVMGISIMVAVDNMHITCATHACSLFSIIGQQIENVISKASSHNEISKHGCFVNTELEPAREEIIYREYIICLKKHQIALKFVDLLNSSFRTPSLVLLMLIVAVLSLMGIRIISVLGQIKEMAQFMFILMGALMQLMIMCYSGQKLMDESQTIFYRTSMAEWYNLSPRIKSLLIITLYRSILPCKLVAGNMFPLSMVTFGAAVRMGMSYFTAFLSFKN